MLRTLFAVTLCLLALQCYSSSAGCMAPHLECDPFWDAITFCSGGRTAVETWEHRWCERCCMGYAVADTGYNNDIFVDGSDPSSILKDSQSLNLAMKRAEAVTSGSSQTGLNRTHFLASGASGAAYVPESTEQFYGPECRRTASMIAAGTCCAGFQMSGGICVYSADQKRQVATLPGGIGKQRCHLHWSVLGDGSCFISRLASHLDPSEYRITNITGSTNNPNYCTTVVDKPLPQVNPDGTFTQPGVSNGIRTIDKCESNMNWCHCCRHRKTAPLFASWELGAGPGLNMDHFDGLDTGGDMDGFGPECRRTASMIAAGTCCAGFQMSGGICVYSADN